MLTKNGLWQENVRRGCRASGQAQGRPAEMPAYLPWNKRALRCAAPFDQVFKQLLQFT